MVHDGASFRDCNFAVFNLAGLGQMTPNTVLIHFLEGGFEEEWNLGCTEFVESMRDVLKHRLNLLSSRFQVKNSNSRLIIDVWPILEPSLPNARETIHLTLMFAYILSKSSSWKNSTIRVFHYCHDSRSDFDDRLNEVNQLLDDCRISANLEIIPLPIKSESFAENANVLIKNHSENADVAFVSVARPFTDAQHYFEHLDYLTKDCCPIVMVCSNGQDVLTKDL
ncbi:hypothetical protein GEMRC1_005794 [Eukaryota sp. GEM-RC1]